MMIRSPTAQLLKKEGPRGAKSTPAESGGDTNEEIEREDEGNRARQT